MNEVVCFDELSKINHIADEALMAEMYEAGGKFVNAKCGERIRGHGQSIPIWPSCPECFKE